LNTFGAVNVFLIGSIMEFSLNNGKGYVKVESYDDETTNQLARVYEQSLI